MAKKVLTIFSDDIDGSEGAEAVDFALDGVKYRIDLGDTNQERLRSALAEFIAAATIVEGPKGGRDARKTAGPSNPRDVQSQRAWWAAEENRVEYSLPRFNDRGRIPGSVADAWRAAGSPR